MCHVFICVTHLPFLKYTIIENARLSFFGFNNPSFWYYMCRMPCSYVWPVFICVTFVHMCDLCSYVWPVFIWVTCVHMCDLCSYVRPRVHMCDLCSYVWPVFIWVTRVHMSDLCAYVWPVFIWVTCVHMCDLRSYVWPVFICMTCVHMCDLCSYMWPVFICVTPCSYVWPTIPRYSDHSYQKSRFSLVFLLQSIILSSHSYVCHTCSLLIPPERETQLFFFFGICPHNLFTQNCESRSTIKNLVHGFKETALLKRDIFFENDFSFA
jgi:hypothetical protein